MRYSTYSWGDVVSWTRSNLLTAMTVGLNCFCKFERELLLDLGDLLGRIQKEDADIGTQHRVPCAQVREIFDVVGPGLLLADTRGVDREILVTVDVEFDVDGVPGGAGDLGDDHSLLSGERVDQCGLAGVALTDDGELQELLLDVTLVILGGFPELLGEFRSTESALRGDEDGIAETESRRTHAHAPPMIRRRPC